MRTKLDDIDLRIVAGLQANGRMPNSELAERVGISAPLCVRRARALEDGGYLKGYYADVDARALGFGIIIFTQIGLASQAEPELKAFVELVATWPLVRECHMLAGNVDFLLKIVVPDWATYQKFLTTDLLSAANISHLKSALSIRTCKLLPGVPIDLGLRMTPAVPMELGAFNSETEDLLQPSRSQRHASEAALPNSIPTMIS